ncbi:MAG: hypothetical protein QOE70_5651 [Chthoniobacter sp.]|jgi:hypothetical protein|nr:hypothetical protein [Chthoniobacter sp.]
MTPRLLILPILAFTATLAHAAKDADLKPSLASPGKIIFEAAFESGGLEKPWTMAKGDWQVKDGAVIGKEKASDMHPAVLILGLPRRDSIIRFSFKMDGAKVFSLSYNQAKGHLFRVVVSPDALAVNKDKDKKVEASKGEPLGRATAKFAKGEWHTMLVEVKGPKVIVQTDNGAKVEASNAALEVDKTGYRFVMRGESLLLDDVKVWEVAP